MTTPPANPWLRLLVATDVPFWEQRNGSHVRIHSLLTFLAEQGIRTRVWHLGDVDLGTRRIVRRRYSQLEVAFMQLPVLDTFGRWWSRRLAGESPGPNSRVAVPKLADFRIPRIAQRFTNQVARFAPDVVLIEYLSLSYLTESVHPGPESQRGERPRLLIDTHDVLSQRDQDFQRAGWSRWLQVSQAEETASLRAFDAIVAIQNHDRETFSRWLPEHLVLVAGQPAPAWGSDSIGPPPAEPVVGFLAGRGDPNRSATAWLLEQVWPQVIAAQPRARLLLAGGVCDDPAAAGWGEQAGVEVIGRVEQTSEFYRRIAFALNPVAVASGLKIKSIEAIGAGRGLLTTAAGAVGLESLVGSAVRVADDPREFAQQLIDWLQHPGEFMAAHREAIEFASCELRPQRVYGELLAYFRSCSSSRGV